MAACDAESSCVSIAYNPGCPTSPSPPPPPPPPPSPMPPPLPLSPPVMRPTFSFEQAADVTSVDITSVRESWDGPYSDRFLAGCVAGDSSMSSCQDHGSESAARAACVAFGPLCGGVVLGGSVAAGRWEVRVGSVLKDSPTGETSWRKVSTLASGSSTFSSLGWRTDGICSSGGESCYWQRDSEGTRSRGTGPGDAYDGRYYMYTEANGRAPGDKFYLRYDGRDCPDGVDAIDFKYHMYGDTMGTLSVKTLSGATPWTRSDNQGDAWRTAAGVPIGASGFFFEMERGAGDKGDAALDQVAIVCMPPVQHPSPLVPPLPPPPPFPPGTRAGFAAYWSEPLTWTAAKEACASRGGLLASPKTRAEQQAARRLPGVARGGRALSLRWLCLRGWRPSS